MRAKRPVEVECRADQRQVCEGLREIAQRFAVHPCFFGIQPEVIRVAKHFLEDQSRLVELGLIDSSSAGQRFHQPETYTC